MTDQVGMHRVFKSRMKMNTICLPNGRICRFVDGRLLTDIPEVISYVEGEIKNGNPFIYMDDEQFADPKLEDPTEKLRAQIRNEILAEMKASNPKNDAGTTEVQKLTPQSSQDIKDVAAGGMPSGSVMLASVKSLFTPGS
jgi:hypothetical protein